jgi:hypothetical protein
MLDKARATLSGFSVDDELVHGIRTARATICIRRETPAPRWICTRMSWTRHPRLVFPRSVSSRRICMPASHACSWAIETPPPPRPRRDSRQPSQVG